jgi:hypothetical protein
MTQNPMARFRSVVPRWVQMVAVVLAGAGLVAAFWLGVSAGVSDGRANRDGNFGGLGVAVVIAIVGAGVSLVTGWILALGFVYGDAKRRGMQAGLWTLMVVFIPNLIGFLLYFALRQPLLKACGSCGEGVGRSQRFCSICGSEQRSYATPALAGSPSFSTTAAFSAPARIADSEVAGARRSGLSMRSFSAGFAVWTGIFLAKSVFACLRHDSLDCAALFGFAAVGFVLLMVSHRKPTASRASVDFRQQR